MFRSFFFLILWQCPDIYLSFPLSSILSCGQPEWQSPLFGNFPSSICSCFFFLFFFFLTLTRSDRLAESRRSVCISKSQRILSVSFSRTDSGLCICHLFVWSNLNFLHNFQRFTFLIQSCLVLYSLCTYLLHSLIMWLIVLSLSPHHLHLLFCCVLSILDLT